MKIQIVVEGISSLMQHNVRLANPLDDFSRAIKVISAKRRKTDDDYEEMARLEFYGGLYHDEELGPYVKSESIRKAFIEGGRMSKQGRQIERGLLILKPHIPLLYEGPRDIQSLWQDKNFVDMRAVGVSATGGTVMRTRPIFKEWAIEFEAEMDTKQLDIEPLNRILEDAGGYVGLGEWRPQKGGSFGRFEATASEFKPDMARQGSAWRGEAGRGRAWLGKAGQGNK